MIATPREYISTPVAARYLKVSDRMVRYYLEMGLLQGTRLPATLTRKPGWWRVYRPSIYSLLETLEVGKSPRMLQGEQHV